MNADKCQGRWIYDRRFTIYERWGWGLSKVILTRDAELGTGENSPKANVYPPSPRLRRDKQSKGVLMLTRKRSGDLGRESRPVVLGRPESPLVEEKKSGKGRGSGVEGSEHPTTNPDKIGKQTNVQCYEIRNPRAEIRKKAEIRNPKGEGKTGLRGLGGRRPPLQMGRADGVFGGTPNTTRETRVLPARIGRGKSS